MTETVQRTSEERFALYDTWTFEIMDRILERDSNCVDVGAHSGAILAEIVRRAPDGEHFAFEPLPRLMGMLRERFPGEHFPHVHLCEMALAEKAGHATFQHVVENPAYSGLRRRSYPTESPAIESLTVRVDRLDAMVPRRLPIRFVKIDVEGGEYGVLRGGTRVLRKSRPYVVFEFGLGAADCYEVRPEHVWSLLDACRLRVSALDDWLEGRPPLGGAEFADRFWNGVDYYFLAHP